MKKYPDPVLRVGIIGFGASLVVLLVSGFPEVTQPLGFDETTVRTLGFLLLALSALLIRVRWTVRDQYQ